MDQVKDLPESIQLRILSLLSSQCTQPNLPERRNIPDNLKSSDIPNSKRLLGKKFSALTSEFRDMARVDAAIEQLQHNSFTILDGLLGGDTVQKAREEAEAYPSLRKGSMGGQECKWSSDIFRGDHISFLLPQYERSSGNVGISAVLTALESLQPLLAAQGFPVDGRITFQLACYPGNGESYVKHRDWSPSCPHRRITATYYLNPTWDKETGDGLLRLYHSDCADSPILAAKMADNDPLNDCIRGDEATTSARSEGETGGRDAAGNAEVAQMNDCHLSKISSVPNGESDIGQGSVDLDPVGDRLVLFRSDTWHEVTPSHKPRFAITAWFSERDTHTRPANPVTTPVPSATNSDSPETQPPIPKILLQPSPPSPHSTDNDSQIFVSIACFRDSECRWTVRDLFSKAAHPSHVRVGIVWQVDVEADKEMMDIWGWEEGRGDRGDRCVSYKSNVRHMVLDWREASGPCKARHLAQTLWRGEEYFFQIDAHMRFAPEWDTRLIHMLRAAQKFSPKPVLSTYPPGYRGLGQDAKFSMDPQPVLLCASKFGQDKILRIDGRRLKEEPHEPIRSRFWAAGYSFSRSELINEVPYDPHLPSLFFGEEMAMAVRMFTSGWDVFAPPKTVVFHLWTRSHRLPQAPTSCEEEEVKRKEKGQSEAWVRSLLCRKGSSLESQKWSTCEMCGEGGWGKGKGGVRERGGGGEDVGEVRGLGDTVERKCIGNTRMGERDEVSRGDERQFGIGNGGERSVQDYVEFCGVNFCEQRISVEARRGGVGLDALLDSLFDALQGEVS